MATHYQASGYTGSSIVWYANQPTLKRSGGALSYVWKGWAKSELATVETLLPADGTGMDAAPTSVEDKEDYKLTEISVSETNAPGISDVELTYTESGGGGIRRKPGDIERRAEVITLSREKVDVSPGAGVTRETVTFAGIRYTHAAYLATPANWTEAQLIAQAGIGINKLGEPTGIEGATANKWIFRGAEVQETGGLARRTETWEYSPLGWDETDPT